MMDIPLRLTRSTPREEQIILHNIVHVQVWYLFLTSRDMIEFDQGVITPGFDRPIDHGIDW